VGFSTRAIAIGTAAPIPVSSRDCYIPAKGFFKRSHSVGFGLFAAAGLLERDEDCIADIKEDRAYPLSVLRLELELERERNRRIETAWEESQAK
jgi:hypothetical protein